LEHPGWVFYPPEAYPGDPGLPTAADVTAPPSPPPGPPPLPGAAPRLAARAPAPPPPAPPAPAPPFPGGPFDRPEDLGALLGSFWAEVADPDEFRGFCRGVAAAWRSAADAAAEGAEAVALDAAPDRRRVEWAPVTVLESEYRASARRPARFGGGRAFGDGLAFGGLEASPPAISTAPYDDVPLVVDSPGATRACLARGVDFECDGASIVLAADPFAEGSPFSPEPVLDAYGEVADRALTLWLWRAGRDDRLLARRAGFPLGVDAPSSPAGRALVAAALDCLAGPSDLAFRRLVAAALDVPLCGSDGERVEEVRRDDAGLVVATDRAAYRFPAAARPVVAPGDRLLAGDPLCDALRFDRLGPTPPPDLPALAVPGGMVPACGPSGLTFAAAEVPVRLAIPGAPA